MVRRTPECDFSGHSSKFQKRAAEVQRSGPYKDWVRQHENNSSFPNPPEKFPEVNPNAWYRASDGTFLKGSGLAPGPLPVNLEETNSPWWEKPTFNNSYNK